MGRLRERKHCDVPQARHNEVGCAWRYGCGMPPLGGDAILPKGTCMPAVEYFIDGVGTWWCGVVGVLSADCSQ